MKSERSTSSRLGRYIKAPMRVLCRVRKLYVQSLTDCSGMMPYGVAMGCPAGVVYTLPKSFSVNSSRYQEDQHLRLEELMKVKQTSRIKELLKSFSVEIGIGIGRIDEDMPCYFPEDFKVNSDKVLFYPRSRSYRV